MLVVREGQRMCDSHGVECGSVRCGVDELTADAAPQVFDNHAPAQRLLLALAAVTVFEAVPVHFLLQAWKPLVAWIVLALTLYSLWWITGAYRVLSARPHLLSAEQLVLRVGSFYTAEIDRKAIVRAARYQVGASHRDVTVLKFITEPNLQVDLSTPVRVDSPFGRKRLASRLAFYVEQPDELLRQLC